MASHFIKWKAKGLEGLRDMAVLYFPDLISIQSLSFAHSAPFSGLCAGNFFDKT